MNISTCFEMMIDERLKQWATPRQAEYIDALNTHGSYRKAGPALGIDESVIRRSVASLRKRSESESATPSAPCVGGNIPRRHFIIPDIQARPGVPLDHCDWVGQAIPEYRPDVVIALGDIWDFPSLNGHEAPGSALMEGRRYKADLEAGNEAFRRISEPMEQAAKKGDWNPRKIVLMGNHEDRADRAAIHDPKFLGHIGSEQCDTRGWERFEFLERVFVDGICYSHYFQSSHSRYPIGGEVSNRLSKIGCSFVQGHEQGKRHGNKIVASGRTHYGIVAGSCYLHVEPYRGAQGQRHWRGCVVLHEVDDGEYDLMELSLKYLCRKYTGKRLIDYMGDTYRGMDWRHLQ